MRIIEQETIDYIKAHINERPRYKLAQRMGVSVKFLYKIMHECDCKFEQKRLVPALDIFLIGYLVGHGNSPF